MRSNILRIVSLIAVVTSGGCAAAPGAEGQSSSAVVADVPRAGDTVTIIATTGMQFDQPWSGIVNVFSTGYYQRGVLQPTLPLGVSCIALKNDRGSLGFPQWQTMRVIGPSVRTDIDFATIQQMDLDVADSSEGVTKVICQRIGALRADLSLDYDLPAPTWSDIQGAFGRALTIRP